MPKKRLVQKSNVAKPAVKKRRQTQESNIARSAKTGARMLQTPKRFWYKPLTWRNHPPVPAYKPLPKAYVLLWTAGRQLWSRKKLFGGIVVIYGLLNLLLVRGLSGSTDLTDFKAMLDGLSQSFGDKIMSLVGSFAYLLASSGSGNASDSGAYQTILLIVSSLAFIWALRQTIAKHTVRIRDSFYQGMYPLVPFVLILLLLAVQLLPLAVGASLYTTVMSNGIAVYAWEKLFWLAILLLLAYWSLRMITATIFALYIVTLPDMTPLRAYRSARQLVYGRRLLIWRKLIFLPVALLFCAALVEIPLIMLVTPVAEWVFFGLSMLALPAVHTYLYNLYREML